MGDTSATITTTNILPQPIYNLLSPGRFNYQNSYFTLQNIRFTYALTFFVKKFVSL